MAIDGGPKVQSEYARDEDMIITADVMIPMRDGVHLAADIYRPTEGGRVPALLALGPYGKALQALSLTLPPQARPSPLWDGCIEAGDIRRVVGHGYAHIIADVRGTGQSQGELCGNYGTGGHGEGLDVYDLVEWIAAQPWCDGNVGMIGISYYASIQILGAAENPPSLKAIFCNGGHFDLYELCYHGGIMWLMPRASREGRGGDSGMAVGRIASRSAREWPAEKLEQRIAERLADPDIRAWPNLVHVLNYTKGRELWLDYVLNPLDGPFYEDGEPLAKAPQVTIPAYIQTKWGRGWTVESTIETYEALRGPKKLDLQPLQPMQERPFHESHEEMFRWYDYWLKGIDNGIMDEAPIQVYVEGARKWGHEKEWPLPGTQWSEFFLRPRHRLSAEAEPLDTHDAPPDGFYQPPMTVTADVEMLSWTSAAFEQPVEMTGPGALHIHVAIDNDDTNLIAKLYDLRPDGSRQMVTSGYLKASHRTLDKERSQPWKPVHPHREAVPVTPHEIVAYAIPLYSFSYMFAPGHKLVLELSCNESFADSHAALLPPDSYHLPSGRATTHKIYRDATYRSHLLLPVIGNE